ncbi:MAG: ABA4-like family protein [Rhizobiaceae bacterium]
MTASTLFSAFNMLAIVGWILMIAGVIFKRPFWRDTLAGNWFPVMLSAAYTVLIFFFFADAEGGFDTLDNVLKLFTNPWVALAGWVHYLAFDMFIGARISRQTMELGLPRWILILLLPLTFMFGPIGYIAFEGIKAFTKGTTK